MRPPAQPSWATRRRPWAKAEYASLDFETTGLDLVRDHVVSFGVVPVLNGRIVLGEAVHQLVEPGAPPSPASVKVHGMRTQDLAGAPTMEEARHALQGALARRFLLAWHAEIEIAFLERTFGGSRRSWWRRTIDTQRLAVAVEGGGLGGDIALSAYARRLGVPVASPHDALDDALVTAQVFLVLTHRVRDGRARVADLLRSTRP